MVAEKRQIVAKLVMEHDQASFKKAEDAVEKLKAKVRGVVKTFRESFVLIMSGYAIGRAFWSFVKAGGEAQEVLNTLSLAFGENTQVIHDWASAYGKATGRQSHDLTVLAGKFGLLTKKFFEAEEGADVATKLAERTTDMVSALQDMYPGKDIQRAMVSGLMGETESIKDLGVFVFVAEMEAFAKKAGLGSYKAMTQAQKVNARYLKILDDTSHLEGDAIKTRYEYTNTTVNFTQMLTKLQRIIGDALLPVMLSLMNGFIKGTEAFLAFAEGTEIVTAALIVLGSIAGVAASKMLIAFLPVIIPMLKLAAVLALVVIAVDDMLVFMKGGDSVIGAFFNRLFGPDTSQQIRDGIKFWSETFRETFLNDIPEAIDATLKKLRELYDFIDKLIPGYLGDGEAPAGTNKEFKKRVGSKLVDKIKKTVYEMTFGLTPEQLDRLHEASKDLSTEPKYGPATPQHGPVAPDTTVIEKIEMIFHGKQDQGVVDQMPGAVVDGIEEEKRRAKDALPSG